MCVQSRLFRIGFALSLCVALGCSFEVSREARKPPWVEFMHADQLIGWLDTSRVRARSASRIEVPLSLEFPFGAPVPGDTARHFTRMEWLVRVDCAAKSMSDEGFTVFDSAGANVGHWRGESTWMPIQQHPSGTTVEWACRKLSDLAFTPRKA